MALKQTRKRRPASRLARLTTAALALLLLAAPASQAGDAPPLRGELAEGFVLLDPPAPAPAGQVTQLTSDGERSLPLSAFRGRVLLVNFWATWCAPCVHEMPALDRLQAIRRNQGLTVMAVSNDRAGARVVMPFLKEHSLAELEVFLDPKGKLARAFGVRGLPTTILIDREGRVVGALQGGPIAWDGPDAVALLDHYLEASPTTAKPLETGG